MKKWSKRKGRRLINGDERKCRQRQDILAELESKEANKTCVMYDLNVVEQVVL